MRPFRGSLRLVLCALVVAVCLVARAEARQTPVPRPAGAATAAGSAAIAAQTPDPFGFSEDEDDTPGWGQLLRSQSTDLLLFTGYAALALVGFFRKSERLKYVTLVATVIYLGIYKSQIVSIVNVYGFLTWNLPIFRYSVAWYLFAVFTLGSTLLWGRLYCGRVCAFGAVTQLMDAVIPKKLRIELPKMLERRAAYVKYGLLGGTLVYFFFTKNLLAFKYVEPFWMFTGGQRSVGLWIALGVLLIATVFIRNLYCRFLCPVGAFLGVLSQVTTVFRIKRWSECKTCKICEKTCEWGAIRGPKIVRSECVRCDDCERLYLDQQKCPHWIIIRRRSDFAAKQPAAPAH